MTRLLLSLIAALFLASHVGCLCWPGVALLNRATCCIGLRSPSNANNPQIVQVAWGKKPDYLCHRLFTHISCQVDNHQQVSHDQHKWRVPVEDSPLLAPKPSVGLCL